MPPTLVRDRPHRHYVNLDHVAVLERISEGGNFRALSVTGRFLGELAATDVTALVAPELRFIPPTEDPDGAA